MRTRRVDDDSDAFPRSLRPALATDLAAHEADTTGVHGIGDTSLLLTVGEIEVLEAGVVVGTYQQINFESGFTAVESPSDSLQVVVTATGGGGGASATTVEKDLGSTPRSEGRFTITDAAIGATSKVLCWQAPGPYTGKGTRADEASMQPVQVVAVEPAAGSAVVYWQTPPMITMQRVIQDSPRLNAAGATFDRLANQQLPLQFVPIRIGKVKGNVKFTYMVMA